MNHGNDHSDTFQRSAQEQALIAHAISSIKALKPHEYRVFRQILCGQDLPAIAQRLGLAESSAQTYLSHIYQTLGAHTLKDVILIGLAAGIPLNFTGLAERLLPT
jgi:DNA-binding NarL/FixJ family response regulator